MFQVLLQYFEDRFAIFYVDGPLSNHQDIPDRAKNAVPFLPGVDDQQIVISYKCFFANINIDRNDSLHVSETFRNDSPFQSEIYRRVYLKVETVRSFQPGFPGKYTSWAEGICLQYLIGYRLRR